MPIVTYYVALPFTRLEDGGLGPGQAVDCPSLAAALQRAEALSRDPANVGAMAFSAAAMQISASSRKTC